MKIYKSLGFFCLVTLILLVLPDDAYRYTSIISFDSPKFINYKWLNGYCSFLFFPFILYLITKIKERRVFVFFSIVLILFSRDVLLCLNKDVFVFKNLNLEMYYALIVGFSLCILIINNTNPLEFFKLFLRLHALSILINFFMGGEIMNNVGEVLLSNRFNAINLDVGSSGLFMSVYLLCLFYSKKKLNYIEVFIAFSALLLTGSRVNFILLLGFALIYTLKRITFKKSVLLILVATLISFFSFDFSSFNKLERILGLFELLSNVDSTNLFDNDSVFGRFQSIKVGAKVLLSYPIGVGFSFIDAQHLMQINGYPTFPHMGILAFYLVCGPIILIVLIKAILLYIKLKGNRQFDISTIILYLIIYNIIAGGLVVNFKIFLFYFLIYHIGQELVLSRNLSNRLKNG